MEAAIEAHAPGSATGSWPARPGPADEAADASLAGGDISAGSFAIDQQLFRPGVLVARAAVKGLCSRARRPPAPGSRRLRHDLAARQAPGRTRGRFAGSPSPP